MWGLVVDRRARFVMMWMRVEMGASLIEDALASLEDQ
jgi:hypothetical protein